MYPLSGYHNFWASVNYLILIRVHAILPRHRPGNIASHLIHLSMKTSLLLTALLATGLATAAHAQTGTTSGSQVQTTTTTPATTTTPKAVGQGATIETQIGTGNTSLAEPNRVSPTVKSPQERNILNGADPNSRANTPKGTKTKSTKVKSKP